MKQKLIIFKQKQFKNKRNLKAKIRITIITLIKKGDKQSHLLARYRRSIEKSTGQH